MTLSIAQSIGTDFVQTADFKTKWLFRYMIYDALLNWNFGFFKMILHTPCKVFNLL